MEYYGQIPGSAEQRLSLLRGDKLCDRITALSAGGEERLSVVCLVLMNVLQV